MDLDRSREKCTSQSRALRHRPGGHTIYNAQQAWHMPSNKNTRENKRRELIFSRQNDKLKFSRSGETGETKQTTAFSAQTILRKQATAFSAQTILRLECEEQRSRFLEHYVHFRILYIYFFVCKYKPSIPRPFFGDKSPILIS